MQISRSKIVSRSLAVWMSIILFLGGCQMDGQTTEERDIQENVQDSLVDQEDGPMTEYVIPDWEAAMRETAGDAKITVQGKPQLYGGGIHQLTLVYAESMADYAGVYRQIFSNDSQKWTAVEVRESFERDGVTYEGVRAAIPSLDGGLYCMVRMGENQIRLAVLEPEGVGEIFADREMPNDQLSGEALLDFSGNLITYQNNGQQYIPEEAYAKVTFYDKKLEEQGTINITGWVLGGVQADAQSPFYLYGYDEEKQPCLWDSNGEKQLLAGAEELDYLAAYAEGGILCITDRSGIWAMEEDGFRELYHYGDHGYYLDTLYGMCRGEGQTLQIFAECDGELLLLTYDLAKRDAVTDRREITLALTMQNVALENVVARFNRQSSSYFVKVLLPEQGEDEDTFRSRLQMELAAGRGPDLLADDVFPERRALVKNGYLECLDGQGFEEMGCSEKIMETGRLDGKLYGIPYDFRVDFAAYRASDMEGVESLTMEQLMERIRSSDAKVLQKYLYGRQLVLQYALSDRSNKAYIDWERGESHLDEQPFLELLEFAREYQYDTNMDNTLQSSDVFAETPLFAYGMGSFSSFRDLYNALGTTNIRVLGYPREEGYGIYLTTNAFYVNSQSGQKEGAVTFLKYLISEEAQTRYVMYDTFKDMKSSGETLWRNTSANFPVNQSALAALIDYELGEKPDDQWLPEEMRSSVYADSQREQFTFLVENAHPAFDLGEISVMMEEELDPFFAGTRTAQETAETLHKRVQLYLDEQK